MCRYYLQQKAIIDKYAQKCLKIATGMCSNDPRVANTKDNHIKCYFFGIPTSRSKKPTHT